MTTGINQTDGVAGPTLADALQGPPRRDVAGMKRQLAEVAPGEPATVLMRSARYGSYLITGVPHLTDLDDVLIGGVLIAGKKDKEKRSDEPVAIRRPEQEVRQYPAVPPETISGEPTAAQDIRHGDLVTGAFEQQPYGRFVVSGVATAAASDESLVMIGPWILSADGSAAPRCVEVIRVAAHGEHTVPVPQLRQVILEDGTAASKAAAV
ncbi:hypothetical protein GCM10022377_27110 [Zhihengliuella alba]|uniref:Uncharacterized protein n=1 Tax=Zhihengliuella alba TaxID=547018 RepID=A0ABP7E1M1_9MICC